MSIYTDIQTFRRDFDPVRGRDLPLRLKLKVIFGNPLTIIGLAFLIISIPFVIVFVGNSDFRSLKFNRNSPVIEGTIDKVTATNSTVNNQRVYKYTYNFRRPDGTPQTGVSFTEGKIYQEGEKVDIEYVYDEPAISRIKGMKTSTFDLWVFLIILPFIIVGGILFGLSFNKSMKAIKLLRYGTVAYGKLIESNPTNTTINKRRVYKMLFEFTARDNKKYIAEARSHTPEYLSDEKEEKLVYNIYKPNDAVLIDSLPKAVKVYFYNLE